MDSIIAEKRIQATEIACEIFCEKNFTEEWWLDNLYDNNKIDELFNLIMDYTQNLNSKEEKGKSWGIDATEKSRIQTESAKIARNYREQQETQTSNQPPQQQEDIKE